MGKARLLLKSLADGALSKTPKIKCEQCGRWIKVVGYADHLKTVHAPPVAADTK